MKKSKAFKLNNKGMSLVEVLVAMIIISIAGVTFLQSFNYSMRNNTRAREKQHALVLAQSMMETFKAYPIEELDKTTEDSGPFTLYTRGKAVTPVISGLVHTYKLNQVDFNGYEYDVTMTAMPASNASLSTSGKVAEIHNPDQTEDAEFKQDFYLEQEKVLQAVWDNIMSQESSYPGLKDYLLNGYNDYSLFDRTLVNIDNRNVNITVSGSKNVTVNVSYSCSQKEFAYVDNNGETKTFPSQDSIGCTVTYACGTFGSLKSVYAYYYPAYKADPAYVTDRWIMCTNDVINVINNSSSAIDVYLVKQELPSITSTVIQPFETSYQPLVYGTGDINLYTNLHTHLYDTSPSGVGHYTASGFSKVTEGLFEADSKEMVYDVVITVYKKGTSDLIYTLTGSTNFR